jgi:hypothetical protein
MNEHFYKHLNKQKEINKDILEYTFFKEEFKNKYNNDKLYYNCDYFFDYSDSDNNVKDNLNCSDLFNKIKNKKVTIYDYFDYSDNMHYYVTKLSFKFNDNNVKISYYSAGGRAFYRININDAKNNVEWSDFHKFIEKYKFVDNEMFFVLFLTSEIYMEKYL